MILEQVCRRPLLFVAEHDDHHLRTVDQRSSSQKSAFSRAVADCLALRAFAPMSNARLTPFRLFLTLSSSYVRLADARPFSYYRPWAQRGSSGGMVPGRLVRRHDIGALLAGNAHWHRARRACGSYSIGASCRARDIGTTRRRKARRRRPGGRSTYLSAFLVPALVFTFAHGIFLAALG